MSRDFLLMLIVGAVWVSIDHQCFPQGTISYYQPPSPIVLLDTGFGQQYPIDIDSDGNTDFTFFYSFIFLGVRVENANHLLILQDPPPNIGGPIAPLSDGFAIGPSSPNGSLRWWSGSEGDFVYLADYYNGMGNGPFAGQRAYMGVEFERAGATHYGWLLLQVSGEYEAVAAIESWAWETRPGVAILAGAVPEPSTLALLSLNGIVIWFFKRRK